jgi:BirA family biotin operon repressor/biotin-[acetyl-CoA-carboxylase] ligase
VVNQSDLDRALAAAGLDAPTRYDEVTSSTNATALELAASGAPEWTLVAAGHQEGGRGRLGRSWVDRPGQALMFSFVLRPEIAAPAGGLLPLLAGAAMATAAGDVAGVGVRCKWPNDLQLGERKVGGILAESSVVGGRLRHVVVGIGVNLEPPPGIPEAAGLGPVDAGAMLEAFLRSFRAAYHPAAATFPAEVRRAWTDRSATVGRTVVVTHADGATTRGVAVGVDDTGGLIVQRAGGEVVVSSGDVAHVEQQPPA